ncbi:MAG TPA: peptidylprolyl isomerase [Steroidobacter sp.]|uniref:peptidylprolyl isomerase n=1 Tax=Steroidobacter sp. TaxID=1978227 RepID=UPI002EDB6E7E
MNRHLLLGLLLPFTLLAGCGKAADNSDSAAKDAGPAVAVVNGKNVSKSEFDLYVENVERQSKRQVADAEKSTLLDQFISMRLAAEAAQKDGIDKDRKVQDQLALARLNVLVDSGLQKWLEKNPVTDAELRPEYDEQVAQMPKEYHARHILVDDQAKAEALTKQLKGGADFAKLAEKNSKDPSGKNGGDLGWFTLETMVKPFSDAVAALQPGQMTDAPVQSQFGWHIIKLEESRGTSAPPFEEVKDRVKMLVQRKKLQTYLEDLRKNAQIEKKI